MNVLKLLLDNYLQFLFSIMLTYQIKSNNIKSALFFTKKIGKHISKCQANENKLYLSIFQF